MSFNLSTVLDSVFKVDVNSASSDAPKEQNEGALTVRSVVEEYAKDLFNDAEFASKNSLEVLHNFQALVAKKGDFEVEDKLDDKLLIAAHICHSRTLKASEEGREINVNELEEIKQAFVDIAEIYSAKDETKELSNKFIVLAEATPDIAKISTAYVKYINSSELFLQNYVEDCDIDQKVKNAMREFGTKLFSDALCTRNFMRSVDSISEVPNCKLLKYDECLIQVPGFILNLALKVENDGRGATAEELESVKELLRDLRLKMGILRGSSKKFALLEEEKKTQAAVAKTIADLPVEQKAKTYEMSQNIKLLNQDLVNFNYTAKLASKYEDFHEAAKIGTQKRTDKISEEESNLEQYTKECAQRLAKLNHDKEEQDKKVESANTDWQKFVAEHYVNASLAETDVSVDNRECAQVKVLMENPEFVLDVATAYVKYLMARVDRLPQEKSWWSFW